MKTHEQHRTLSSIGNKLDSAGVYFLYDYKKRLIYIGKSKSLLRRVQSSITDKNAIYARFLFTETEAGASIYEIYYIAKYKPKFNVKGCDLDCPKLTLPKIELTEFFKTGRKHKKKYEDVSNISWVRKHRKLNKWSQKELGNRVGLTRVSINRIESGEQSLTTVAKLAFMNIFDIYEREPNGER